MYPTAAVPNTAEAEARRLFLDDPGRSIDDVARDLDRTGMALKKHVLSRIRHDIRAQIEKAHQPVLATPPIIRKRDPFRQAPQVQIVNRTPQEPFNPPRIVQITKAETLPPLPPPLEVRPVSLGDEPAPVESNPAHVPVVPLEDRKRWLEDWLLEHPEASVPKAREALLKKFGMTMSTTTISDLVKTAREIHHPTPPEPVIVEAGKSGMRLVEIADLAHAMKVLGVRKIELHGLAYVVDLEEAPG